jgi:purine-binding chemotaxis protein CheW
MHSTPAADVVPRTLDDRVTAALVVVRAGAQRFALPVGAAREIAPVREATPLPGSAPWVRGLVNLRGRIVTVLDLAGRLGLEGDPAAPEPRVVFVEYGGEDGRLGGVEVEAVLGVVPAAAVTLHAAADAAEVLDLEPALVRSLGRAADGEPFVLLDADALFHSFPAPAPGRSAPPNHPSEG